MTIKELDSKIAKLEGKKHQAKVGDVREIRKLISIELAKDPLLVAELIRAGEKLLRKGKV